MALVQFWPDWMQIVIIAGIFALGQFIEGNFLSPKLVGDRIGLHPVWLMFALFAFGYLFGFVGLLLAVPLAAAAGVLIRFALDAISRKPALSRGADAAAAARPHPSRDPPNENDTQAPRQLVLDLAPRPAYGQRGFSRRILQSACAAAFIETGPLGPHARRCWSARRESANRICSKSGDDARSGALVDIPSSLIEALVPDIMPSGGAVALEHAPDATLNERALFHLLNAARENRGYVLIASRDARPGTGALTLPDLISRLEAAPAIQIQPADDDLLRGVLVKLFADRQSPWMTGSCRISDDPDAAVAWMRRAAWSRQSTTARSHGQPAEARGHCIAQVLADLVESADLRTMMAPERCS